MKYIIRTTHDRSAAICQVTSDNRLLYISLLADWHLNVRLGRAAEAFARGLAQLIPPGAFR